jgi:hypothetical protein
MNRWATSCDHEFGNWTSVFRIAMLFLRLSDRNRVYKFSVIFSVALLAGCGSKFASVEGTVTLDGTPIAAGSDVRGTVTFYPTSGNGVPAVGTIDANGRYEMSTVSHIGVPPGSYAVAVTATRIIIPEPGATPSGQIITPRRYSSTKESNLHAEVQPGENTIDFALKSGPNG